MTADIELPVRIIVRRPPAGVALAIQRGRDELLEPVERTGDAVVFEFSIRVREAPSADGPRFLGEYTQGPPAARFVYVNSGTSAGQAASCWTRRAKVPLAGISWPMIEAAMQTPGGRVETEFGGTGADGGPTCATVKGITWRVASP